MADTLLNDIADKITDLNGSLNRLYATDNDGTPNNAYVLLSELVNRVEAQTIDGIKTFIDSPIVPTPTANYQASTKKYIDDFVNSLVFTVAVAASALDTDLTAATSQAIYAAPEDMTITQVFAKVGTAPTGSTIVVDINVNASTILSTKISIDVSEKTSLTAATPPVISSASLTQGDEITIDIDQVGATIAGKDLTVYILGTKA